MADERPIFSKAQVQDVLRTRDAIKDIQFPCARRVIKYIGKIQDNGAGY